MADTEVSEELAEPPKLWREELKRAWREMRGVETTPGRAALAVGLGLFIGSQPTPGAHTPLVITICLLTQLDALSAWIASNISNPLFWPFLITAEVQVGAYLNTGAFIPFDPQIAREAGLSGFLLYAFSGSLVVGLGLALLGMLLVYCWVWLRQRYWPVEVREPYRLPKNAPPWWHAVERVAGRYAPVGERSTPAQRTRFHYVRSKLMSDPVTKMLADLFGDKEEVLGDVLDIGTGRGQMPIVLLELGRARSVRGLDWDEGKVAAAQEAAELTPGLKAVFTHADANEASFEPADTVMLIDVIHYLTIDEQNEVLRRAAAAVKSGGHLVVREADTERSWRSWLTLAEELLFTTLRFNRGARVKFRPAREIRDIMTAAGLSCEVRPAWGKTPFSNVLVIGKRAG